MLFRKKDNAPKIASKSKKKWLLATIAATPNVADYETLVALEDVDFVLVPKTKKGQKKAWEATINGITIRVTEVSMWWQDWTAKRIEKETLT